MDNTTAPLGGVAEPIRGHMIRLRYTERSLSDATGIAYTTLRRRLRAPSQLTMSDILALATALDISPADLAPQVLASSAVA